VSRAESVEVRALLFRVGTSVYGCDIGLVREIVPFRPTTRLPGAQAHVLGLMNLRGTILTVVDLGSRLEAGRPRIHDGSIIVVGVEGRQVGLAVTDVMDVAPLHVESTPGATEDEVVRGLGHLGETVVILLDVPVLVGQVLN
jgi:purine-binding chemotaxis protein CheW